jgi:hypothetical protein
VLMLAVDYVYVRSVMRGRNAWHNVCRHDASTSWNRLVFAPVRSRKTDIRGSPCRAGTQKCYGCCQDLPASLAVAGREIISRTNGRGRHCSAPSACGPCAR